MHLFKRKSKWEHAADLATSAAAAVAAGAAGRRAVGVGGGVVAAAVGLTALSAAISSTRQREQK